MNGSDVLSFVGYQCPRCKGTGLAHCHPDSCKNHHGRACDNVDERGLIGCPPCKFCKGKGRYNLTISVTVGENSGSVFSNGERLPTSISKLQTTDEKLKEVANTCAIVILAAQKMLVEHCIKNGMTETQAEKVLEGVWKLAKETRKGN